MYYVFSYKTGKEDSMDYQYKENSFGEIFSKGFGMFFDNFLPLIGIAFLMYLPVAVFDYLLTKESYRLLIIMQTTNQVPTSYLGILLLTIGVLIFETLLVSSVMTYYISNKAMGQEESFFNIIKKALKKFFPLLGLSIVSALLIMIGFILLVIPGIIIALSLSIVIQVMLLENLGIKDSIKRSRELTKGAKGRIFWVIFFLGVITGIISILVQKISVPIAQGTLSSGGLDTFILVLYCFAVIPSILSSALGACMTVSIYFSRRSEKDGLGLEQMISGYIRE